MAELSGRLLRERVTVDKMIELYCRENHAAQGGLCAECAVLSEYARQRLQKCVFGAEKPTCANCPVHCYKVSMRERVREMMRYAGPRMMLHHPILAVAHLLDGRRKAPPLPQRKKSFGCVPFELKSSTGQRQG